jgi:hypothetical protein
MLHEYHIIYSVRYCPQFHVTTVGVGTYYPWIQGHYCNDKTITITGMKRVLEKYNYKFNSRNKTIITLLYCFADCASRYMHVMKPTWCTMYLQLFHHYTHTRFRLPSCPLSRGSNIYICKRWYMYVCFIYRWLLPDDWQLASLKRLEV